MAESSSSQPAVPPSSQPPPPPQTSSSTAASSSTPVPPPSSQPPVTSPGTVVPKQEPDVADSNANKVLDAPTEQEDVDMTNAPSTNANANANPTATSGADDVGNPVPAPTSVDALAAAAAPSKKETSLREFLGKMDEYAPIIPDAVTAHYLTLAGLPPPGNGPNQTPPHLARLLALATQKFIADIAADSYQYARIRASNSSSANNPMGSLNAASGLGMPGGAGGVGSTGAATGPSGGEAGKGKAGTHLGIQRPGFGGGGSGGSGQGRTVLTMEDLGMAVAEYGVSVKRGEFYR
ncbi:putative TFIID and and SAGA complex TAF10 subunit [Aspergillus fijiensis CBS 313.89]|uniref:Transcription initiation factor IID, TAF10 subunit n=1 Tax=Aspergillus fijiensis CBS 313.89 TaxID=1448319 RepID=A0A8G1RVY9_9EURO|nr:transcription initiation factor IID, TAF10 subunit [Aspergillus fijiensis CBS 313.89]RAK79904.1 transcription initiation factor IID, TAF10 subunit [Aspergillus fijiensis CBS 313.89]